MVRDVEHGGHKIDRTWTRKDQMQEQVQVLEESNENDESWLEKISWHIRGHG